MPSVIEIGNSAQKILPALRKKCEDRNSKKVTSVSLINAAKIIATKKLQIDIRAKLGVNRKTIQRVKRNGAKCRNDEFNKDKVKRFEEFYLRNDI